MAEQNEYPKDWNYSVMDYRGMSEEEINKLANEVDGLGFPTHRAARAIVEKARRSLSFIEQQFAMADLSYALGDKATGERVEVNAFEVVNVMGYSLGLMTSKVMEAHGKRDVLDMAKDAKKMLDSGEATDAVDAYLKIRGEN
jgi:hypothetical protein